MSEELIKQLIDRIEELEFKMEEFENDMFELRTKIAEVENEAYEEFISLHKRLT
jgi:chaperonin cofactor prefoldin